MKSFFSEALAALRSGENVVAGAVQIGSGDDALRVWGGYGTLVLDDGVYVGVGDRGLVSASAGALGGAEQGAELILSGVDPAVAGQIDLMALRGQPVVIWRLIFDGTGANLLQASVFLRGRVDEAPTVETPGGEARITIKVEGAARGLGRRSERMRTDADQRLISPTDSFFSRVSYAGEKTVYFGGKQPQRASSLLTGG